MDVCLLWVLCVLSGRGLWDELITRPEESYRLWFVVVCDLETSRMRRPWPALGRSATGKKKIACNRKVEGILLSINISHVTMYVCICVLLCVYISLYVYVCVWPDNNFQFDAWILSYIPTPDRVLSLTPGCRREFLQLYSDQGYITLLTSFS